MGIRKNKLIVIILLIIFILEILSLSVQAKTGMQPSLLQKNQKENKPSLKKETKQNNIIDNNLKNNEILERLLISKKDNSDDPDDPLDEIKPPAVTVSSQMPIQPLNYTYPRLSLGTAWLQDMVEKQGLEFVYQFDEIYGTTPSERILDVKQLAIQDGHQDWVDKTTFIQMDCMQTAYWLNEDPPEWQRGYARNNIGTAKNLAVYYNQQLGCDWYLRDMTGSKIPIWGDHHFALDNTPDCDLGLWDGIIEFQGEEYCIGSTIGLSYYEWLSGPFTENVLNNSLFSEAYDGIHMEDIAGAWMYYYRGYIPDPKHDGVGFPDWRELEEYCRDTWNSFYTDFLRPLNDRYITRMNGHGLRYMFEGWNDPWPLQKEAFTACKLERYGGWGGWPHWDLPMWIKVYIALEQKYHPLSENPNDPDFDYLQGWDVSTIQCNAKYSWTDEKIKRWKRLGLASTLMGDGYFDGYAYEEDYFFHFYLRHGQSQYEPTSIPEMEFELGRALGNYKIYNIIPLKPLYYRQFYNDQSQTQYTVVLNVWNFEIAEIPAQDGIWFEGNWPYGEYTTLELI